MKKNIINLIIVLVIMGISGCTKNNSQTKHPLQSLSKLPKSYTVYQAPPIADWITKEGARVLFIESTSVPMFDVQVNFAAGSARDGQQHGLALLTNAMLGEGYANVDANKIAEEFELLGAQFSTNAYRDMAIANLRSISEPSVRENAVKLFAQVIGKPSFPISSLVRIKNQTITSFKHKQQNAYLLAQEETFKSLYGKHPYAHSSAGTEQIINNLSRKNLIAFHTSAYSASNAVITIVGDLTVEEAKKIAAQISSNLPKSRTLDPLQEPKERIAISRHINFSGEQTHIMLASLGIDRNHPDYAALIVGNHILGGGGFGSKLMTELREKRGVTYGIYSGFSPMATRGPFIIQMQTSSKYSKESIALIKKILENYIKTGPTEQELKDAQNEILNSFSGVLSSNSNMLGQLSMLGFYKMPLTWIGDYQTQVKNLTVEQVHEAMKRYLDPNKMLTVTVGPNVKQQKLPEPIDYVPTNPVLKRKHM